MVARSVPDGSLHTSGARAAKDGEQGSTNTKWLPGTTTCWGGLGQHRAVGPDDDAADRHLARRRGGTRQRQGAFHR